MTQKIEELRLVLQASLDVAKSARERNELGQFATPTNLAREVVGYGLSLLREEDKVRFLDPAIGTGSFYSALLAKAPRARIERAMGFEIDPHYGAPARELWASEDLDYRFGDFTSQKAEPDERANLLICNPPYVRHHHIGGAEKKHLQVLTERACGVRMQGLAGLYCYFLGLSHPWMAPGGVAGWLIPSEFMDVNYGVYVKEYLLTKVTLLRIHRFDPNDVQFGDALVTSAVVWIRNEPPRAGHHVEFTYGGSLLDPTLSRSIPLEALDPAAKWTRYPQNAPTEAVAGLTVGGLFKIRRGIATGDNGFFVLTAAQAAGHDIPAKFLKPILPGSRHIPNDEIRADANGEPALERRLLLLDCRLPERVVEAEYPALWRYLQRGIEGASPVAKRYLCRTRSPWYSQEVREPAPLLCTYMGRSGREGKRPFRFFLNHSEAIAGNVYLMLYPKPLLKELAKKDPDVIRRVWCYLNEVPTETLLGEGRVYGGGLHKLEPKELAKVSIAGLVASEPSIGQPSQADLFRAVA